VKDGDLIKDDFFSSLEELAEEIKAAEREEQKHENQED
jgi:hypothetical protein